MASHEPNQPRNTREYLPAAQNIKIVPMSAEEFQRQRTKKVLMWAAGVATVLAIAAFATWRSSTPSAAKSDFDDGVKLFKASRYREAVQAFTNSIGQKSNLADAYQYRGLAYRYLDDPADSIKDLSRAIQFRPAAPDNYRVRADCYRELGRYADAVNDLNRLIELRASAAAFNARGLCYREMGRKADAIQDFSRAINLEPAFDYFLQRGMAYDATGDHARAIADYNRAIELRPEVPHTYRARASAKESIGDLTGAEADRGKALAIESPPLMRAEKIAN
jgi:tetratricopeptide (TPR) repeat protein